MKSLPIEAVLDDLKAALALHPRVVLTAPPGAGKTTGVPPALLGEEWVGDGRILLLEPRRLATRAAAARMAALYGESVGQTVGYRSRMDSRIGPRTRIEVITTGVLTRMLQNDPALVGVALVIFDEFHERSVEADLGLALSLDLQGVFNPHIKILIMSATLESAALAQQLDLRAVTAGEGRAYPVTTHYHPATGERPLEAHVASAIFAALKSDAGSILVFLPGAGEIRRVARRLEGAALGREIVVAPLFGLLGRREQDRAIMPAPAGCRKIVLATDIAETSLTIEGITIVIDSGLARKPRFDVGSGMSRLTTQRISRASANQRRGRAGRTGPGICHRLWSRHEQRLLRADLPAQILEADLAPLALELALWGVTDPGELSWLDPPPAAAFGQARKLLATLGALDADGRISDHGRRMAGLPLHPRLAHMVIKGAAVGLASMASELAALLSERDPITFAPGRREADLGLRMETLRRMNRQDPPPTDFTVDYGAGRRILALARRIRSVLEKPPKKSAMHGIGTLVAWAFPDRIAKRRAQINDTVRYTMTNGKGAKLALSDSLAAAEYLATARLDGKRDGAQVFLAAALPIDELTTNFADQFTSKEVIQWDAKRAMVTAAREVQLDRLVLFQRPLGEPDPDRLTKVLLQGIRRAGAQCLPWNKRARRLQQRIGFLARHGTDWADWPDLSDAALMQDLEDWLAPYIRGMKGLRDLKGLNLTAILTGHLDWRMRPLLDELAPTHLTVPSGSRLPVDYSVDPPVLAVRLQELFGLLHTPTVARGRVPLLLHLLSPAGRPAQITQDLVGFWESGYHQVKKELRGRYPKHHWPDDPRRARPTKRAKGRKASRRTG